MKTPTTIKLTDETKVYLSQCGSEEMTIWDGNLSSCSSIYNESLEMAWGKQR